MSPSARRRRWRAALAAALAASAALAALWAWREGLPGRVGAALVDATVRSGLRIEEVWTEGRAWTDPRDLARTLEGVMGAPSLLLDVDEVRSAVEGLDWVAHAEVSVRLPGRLDVRIHERRPAALWQHEGRLRVVDGTGTVIESARPADFPELLHVVGAGVPEALPGLAGILARAPDIVPQIRVASWISERRWTLHTTGLIDIHLPEEGAGDALVLLREVAQEHGLFFRDIETIDLRGADRMAVRLRNGRRFPDPSEPDA